MASGNTLLHIPALSGSPPATLAAQFDFIAGTSTPAESIPVIAFDPTTVEYMDFRYKMPQNYAGGGVTAIICSGAGTTTGTLQWAIAFRAFKDDADDLDTTAKTYDYNTVNIATLANVVGEVTYDNITFTNGADMDSLAAGDEFILRIRRDTGSDTASTDAYLHGIELREV
jgi:hypothetical protein